MKIPHTFASRGVIAAVLLLQVVPLMLFPGDTFSSKSQEWWLPALLTVLALVATIQLLVRGTDRNWPWDLVAFAQGFNIISRLMMVWPKATLTSGGVTAVNGLYILMTLISIIWSWLMLWYTEQPTVRIAMIRKDSSRKLV